jgi:molybdopterin/thiamine biosynthesis adenylyltransferase
MITIVGVGALGSHVALFLRNEKAGLKVIDFDRVETKNTQSQFHSVMSNGKNKAQALQQAFQGLFGVKVAAVPHKLKQDNAREIFGNSKLVIDCTDNIEARKVISASCNVLLIPLLHGALSASGDFARVVWREHFKPDAESGDVQATCVDGEHLPFHGLAASLIAVEAQRFLKTGKKASWQLTPSGIVRLA